MMGLVTMTNAALYCIRKPKRFSYMSQCRLLSFLLPKKRKSISMCTNRIAVQVAVVRPVLHWYWCSHRDVSFWSRLSTVKCHKSFCAVWHSYLLISETYLWLVSASSFCIPSWVTDRWHSALTCPKKAALFIYCFFILRHLAAYLPFQRFHLSVTCFSLQLTGATNQDVHNTSSWHELLGLSSHYWLLKTGLWLWGLPRTLHSDSWKTTASGVVKQRSLRLNWPNLLDE